ncbi:NAD(P)-dependent oxidoreductase [Vibrio nigripulchritudo]|uniref:NAD(P)-dependent oxidoreductase n=1 Tax=Vibrio nigripulchritudo TaxID=28173 RepID=UPI0003B1AE2D|nr:NAD(P)-dependent oxidoreductase [Vibrio nigripulchritudo]CCN73499.1 putative 3-hydroxyisobutyrate dehydrogenase [Vibrio nigripulchritudo SFn118]
MDTQKRIGLIGLGSMGLGMAQTLIREGFEVFGLDPSAQQQQAARTLGVAVAQDIESLCQLVNNIILSLPTAKHVMAVIEGEGGIIEHAQPNTLIMDTTTSEPEVTRRLADKLSQLGHAMLDCPLSGGAAGASAGTMVILVGGSEEALVRATPFLDALSAKMVHLGESGNGHVAKLVNNLLCAAHLVTTAEAITLGEKAGLDPALLIEGLNAGSGRSAISEVNFPRWILNEQFDSGFTMQLMRKDLGLAKALLDECGLSLPISESVAQIWSQSEGAVEGSEDFNRITQYVKKESES